MNGSKLSIPKKCKRTIARRTSCACSRTQMQEWPPSEPESESGGAHIHSVERAQAAQNRGLQIAPM